jgi:hypothetical protein
MPCRGLWALKEADVFRAVTGTVMLCRTRQPGKAVRRSYAVAFPGFGCFGGISEVGSAVTCWLG